MNEIISLSRMSKKGDASDTHTARSFGMQRSETIIRGNPSSDSGKEKKDQSPFRFSQISLWLDSYTNIFSDFDPRPYSQRALSHDFLSEIKRASSDKESGTLELSFLIDRKKRDHNLESTIRRRLKAHFKHHVELLKKEKDKTIIRGLLFSMVGVVLMFATTIVIFRYEKNSSIITSFLIVLLEPAGWFSFWEGLNTIFFESKSVNPELAFYRKMMNASITFISQDSALI